MTTEQTSDTAQTPAQQTPTSAVTEGQSPKREYTQAELDQMFSERATRAASAATSKMLKTLGLASEDELTNLKATIDESRKRQEADMTATQKAEKAAAEASARAATLEQELDKERQARINDRLDAAIRDAAKTSADADLVLMYARQAHAEALKAALTDDHQIDKKKLDAVIEIVKKEKPALFAQTKVGGIGSPSNATSSQKGEKPKIDLGSSLTKF